MRLGFECRVVWLRACSFSHYMMLSHDLVSSVFLCGHTGHTRLFSTPLYKNKPSSQVLIKTCHLPCGILWSDQFTMISLELNTKVALSEITEMDTSQWSMGVRRRERILSNFLVAERWQSSKYHNSLHWWTSTHQIWFTPGPSELAILLGRWYLIIALKYLCQQVLWLPDVSN